jgi:hypothetical protein
MEDKLELLIGRIDERTLSMIDTQEQIKAQQNEIMNKINLPCPFYPEVSDTLKKLEIEIEKTHSTSALEDERIRTTIKEIAVIVSMLVSVLTAFGMLILQWIINKF